MKIIINKTDGNLCFSLCGELDECSSNAVRMKIDDVLESRDYLSVTFDFENLSFMDSTGIGVIIGRYKKLKPKYISVCKNGMLVDFRQNIAGYIGFTVYGK